MSKIIWGNVTALGTDKPTIYSGHGFSVTRLDSGCYLIDFKGAGFNEVPAFAITQQYSLTSKWDDFSSKGGDTRDNAVIIALNNEHAKVKTGGNTGDAVDRNFSFIAMGV